jgi:integrase
MRVKNVRKTQNNLHEVVEEFISFKTAQKLRERTIAEYRKYLNDFVRKSADSLDLDDLKEDLLSYFAAIPDTSPARYNHPYQYLHALFSWCVKQDYLIYNPFEKLDLKKRRDEGNVQPASIEDIQAFLKCLDKGNYCELRDYTITVLMLDTGIRTSELLALRDTDYSSKDKTIVIRQEVSKTSRGRTLFLSTITDAALRKFLKTKPDQWDSWLFPTRDGLKLETNVLGRNFRKYCRRAGVQFTPYQLRHSFATFYLQNGGDLFTLQRQMGHSDLQMTRRYTDISDELISKSHGSFSPVRMLQNTTRKVKI